MNKNKILLKVRNVKKYFHSSNGVVNAIDDISFDVKEGEIVGLIGESGSGKTTVGRCLIRLYDNYSGFVSLKNQAISGKKLNKKKKLFLNKNMQMIFQDPHASLNGQQNIFTILKEPLIVNKIMKKEYKDFFLDWSDIIENFEFEFKRKFIKIQLDTITYHADQASKLLNEWIDVFRRIKFKYIDIENDFNQYFAFKLSSQQREANVINKIFENNSKILDLYFEYQKKFRNNKFVEIKQNIKKAKEKYVDIVNKSKITDFELRKMNLYLAKKYKLKDLERTFKNTISNHKNIVNSYINEFKDLKLSYLTEARKKDNYDEYKIEIINYLLSKKINEIFSNVKNDILFLSSEKIDDLSLELKKYKKNFFNELNNNISKDEKQIVVFKKYINDNFKFDFKKYIENSKNKKDKLLNEIKKLKKELSIIDFTFENRKNKKTIYDRYDLEKAKEQYFNAKDTYKKNIEKYINLHLNKIKDYELKISREYDKLNEIRKDLEKIEIQFKEKHNEFIEGLINKLKEKGETEHQIKNHISIYENKISLKNKTLESFNLEIKILKNDLSKLEHLLGLKKSFSTKKYIKDILLKEKIYRSLDEVGLLRQFAWRYPHEFSGGQRQRIVIARALISNPKIIIADEPIASLDVSIQAQVVNILKELCEKKNVSLIFIAHDLSMVEYIADKILIMHLGKIVEFGKTEEIYSNPVHPYTINLFKSAPKISNANDKFKQSNFELKYLEEQKKYNSYLDFYELNENHIIYSTPEQFEKWTNKKPKLSKYSINI